MSMKLFLAVDKPLNKREYSYKNILPSIKEGDMFYNDRITFNDKLDEAEEEALGNLFSDFKVYAVNSGFKFSYSPEYKRQLSESYAQNALDELKWLKQFAKKRLLNSDVFMVVNLWLGRETPFNRIKTTQIEVDGWELTQDKAFEFAYATVYQFTDNSEEAINRRRNRFMQNGV